MADKAFAPEPTGSVLTGPTRLERDGELVGVVARAPDAAVARWRRALLRYPMRDDGARRHAGFNNQSQVVGYLGPSERLKRIACAPCNMALTRPAEHAAVAAIAGDLADLMREECPDGAAVDGELVDRIHPDWRLPGGLFTSGIVNRDSTLPYHRDLNNLPGAWSAMAVLRRGVRGGHLHLPELDVTLACSDGDVVFFRSQELEHAVTPLRRRARDGYRITVVFYVARRLTACGPAAEEAERAGRLRTATDADLIERHRRRGLLPPTANY
jgi:hypothetical protein